MTMASAIHLKPLCHFPDDEPRKFRPAFGLFAYLDVLRDQDVLWSLEDMEFGHLATIYLPFSVNG
jgi:hypothetical protein